MNTFRRLVNKIEYQVGNWTDRDYRDLECGGAEIEESIYLCDFSEFEEKKGSDELATYIIDHDSSIRENHEENTSGMEDSRQETKIERNLKGESWICATLLLMKQLFGVQRRSRTFNYC